MTARPLPVVLDVDTGVDDACALLLAARHPGLDLRAVTCVGGNAPLDRRRAQHPRRARRRPGAADVPVARAPSARCSSRPVDARHVHGEDGMGDLGRCRRPPCGPTTAHAVDLLRDGSSSGAAAGRPVTARCRWRR